MKQLALEFNPKKKVVRNRFNVVWLKAYMDALYHNRPLCLIRC